MLTVLHGAESPPRAPWVPDWGDGTYRNPVLHADYSDPDVIRVGDDFYLVASSFNCTPGLPVLHSRDLVNWRILNHALPRQAPEQAFRKVRHGGGVWAPAIRFLAGTFYIYYPDPDYGIYVVSATDPAGEWSPPVLVKAGLGLIDPCPLWDDDGRVYLVHAWAQSRAGRNNLLTLLELSADGSRAVGGGWDIVRGNAFSGMRTLEGPKFYKFGGWYYIFAPIGGVAHGNQAVFRSQNIEGPYECRIVLDRGATEVNGPHQGGLVDTPGGEWWFMHFQDKGPFGRVVHLEPVAWKAGWPVIGDDPDGDGCGQPVPVHRKPDVGRSWPVAVPQTSDEFDGARLGLQWQWQANPDPAWLSLAAKPGMLRLFSQPPEDGGNLHGTPSLLLQKFPSDQFTVTTVLDFVPAAAGERAGLIVFGDSYAWIGLVKTDAGLRLSQAVCRNAIGRGGSRGLEAETAGLAVKSFRIFLRLAVSATPRANCRFSYSEDNVAFLPLGTPFDATAGRWVGAKFGLFALTAAAGAKPGLADFDWLRVEPGSP